MTFQNTFHYLRKYHFNGVQSNFCFVDTESYSHIISKQKQKLTFRLACVIFWNRLSNEFIEKTYYNTSEFWFDIEKRFNKNNRELFLFAHNTEFDMKMLNGYEQLTKNGWFLEYFYVRNKVYMFHYKKDKNTLKIYSTTNYFAQPLKALGKMVGKEKLDVDFNNVSNKELEIYCKRDTEIIYLVIKYLLDFLEQNEYTKLRATAGSIAFNTFLTKFYKPKSILIHNWKEAIKLERESYHGGISDCFNLHELEQCYKLDINSQYPKQYEKPLPSQLLMYIHESNILGVRPKGCFREQDLEALEYCFGKFEKNKEITQEQLFKLLDLERIKDKKIGLIVKIKVNISKKNAYLLNNFGLGKTSFCYGNNIILTVCQPEIDFIRKNNMKISHIYSVNVYQLDYIFKTFVQEFYPKKVQAKKESNKSLEAFSKLILNTLYGKFGQKTLHYEIIDNSHSFILENYDIIIEMIKELKSKDEFNLSFSYLGSINHLYEVYISNNQIYILRQTEMNTPNTFVAIASFITSYARMDLIKYLCKAKRENVWYCDTDSLFVNKIGYQNLKNDINEYQLGKLKVEGIGKCKVYAPKFYDFQDIRKVKGIKKHGSRLLIENDTIAKYEIESWNRFKTDLKHNTMNVQIIETTIKEISKIYDKGKIVNGIIEPYSISEIYALT